MKNKIVKILWTFLMPIIVVCLALIFIWFYVFVYQDILFELFGERKTVIWCITTIILVLLPVFYTQTIDMCSNCAHAWDKNPMYNTVKCCFGHHYIMDGDDCCPIFANKFRMLRDKDEQSKFEEYKDKDALYLWEKNRR